MELRHCRHSLGTGIGILTPTRRSMSTWRRETSFLAVGTRPPALVEVSRWIDPGDGSRLVVVRRTGGDEMALSRQSHAPLSPGGRDDVVAVVSGEGVWVRLVDPSDALGSSLPLGHIWPPPASVEDAES